MCPNPGLLLPNSLKDWSLLGKCPRHKIHSELLVTVVSCLSVIFSKHLYSITVFHYGVSRWLCMTGKTTNFLLLSRKTDKHWKCTVHYENLSLQITPILTLDNKKKMLGFVCTPLPDHCSCASTVKTPHLCGSRICLSKQKRILSYQKGKNNL